MVQCKRVNFRKTFLGDKGHQKLSKYKKQSVVSENADKQVTLILSGVVCMTSHKCTVMNGAAHMHFTCIAGGRVKMASKHC